MLADVVENYLKARSTPTKASSETRLALRQFEHAVGRKALAAITRPDVIKFVEHVANHTIGGKTPGSIVRPISEQSVSKRLRMLGSAINHARNTGAFDGPNPMRDIKVSAFVKRSDPSIMPKKRRFQTSELNLLFKHPWFTGCKSPTEPYVAGRHRLRGAEFWVPIVALYTGCRAGELAGLKLSEVRLDDPLPHFIVRPNEYRGVKNGHMRQVPVLEALVEMGFVDYLKRIELTGHDRVFPDWTVTKKSGSIKADDPAWSNAKIIRAFNRNVASTALGDKRLLNARLEVTFHGLRGSFKAMLLTNKVPSVIVNEVVAHAHNDLDDRYVGKLSIEETYPEVHKCDYKGLIKPVAPK